MQKWPLQLPLVRLRHHRLSSINTNLHLLRLSRQANALSLKARLGYVRIRRGQRHRWLPQNDLVRKHYLEQYAKRRQRQFREQKAHVLGPADIGNLSVLPVLRCLELPILNPRKLCILRLERGFRLYREWQSSATLIESSCRLFLLWGLDNHILLRYGAARVLCDPWQVQTYCQILHIDNSKNIF